MPRNSKDDSPCVDSRASNPPQRAARRSIPSGPTAVQIPLQRGQRTALCEPRPHKRNFNSRRASEPPSVEHTRTDWDSRQLSPSSGGGSDRKCCFHSCDAESLITPAKCVIRWRAKDGAEVGLEFLCGRRRPLCDKH